jgi:hypothetical protein
MLVFANVDHLPDASGSVPHLLLMKVPGEASALGYASKLPDNSFPGAASNDWTGFAGTSIGP